MTHIYSSEARARSQHTLPDIEVFYADNSDDWENENGERKPMEPGWYWWTCLPGCLPESEPYGPFASESDAIENAQIEY